MLPASRWVSDRAIILIFASEEDIPDHKLLECRSKDGSIHLRVAAANSREALVNLITS